MLEAVARSPRWIRGRIPEQIRHRPTIEVARVHGCTAQFQHRRKDVVVENDLFAVSRSDGDWGTPILLTSASTHDFNEQPAISANGATVAFDCGPTQYGQKGTALCVVGTDGTGFTTVLSPTDSGAPSGTLAVHHSDFAPDGSFVAEIDTGTETLWRLSTQGSLLQIAPSIDNDNSPCVLADGRIVSLWLNSPDNPQGLHELKVMDPDGSNSLVLLPGVDVVDAGFGCGGGMSATSVDEIFASGFETGNTSDWSSQTP